MAQINFNDKNNGDFLTPQDVNDIKNAINDNEGLLSNGNVSGYYDSNNQFRYNHHFIPESNSNFDLGSAEYKVRHLFLSDNSLWIGDENKIDASNGEVKTKKRNKSKLPYYITGVLDGEESAAYSFLNVDYAEEITLKGLEEYAQSLNPNATLVDIFPPETHPNYSNDDYELIFQQSDIKKKLEQSFTYHNDWSVPPDNGLLEEPVIVDFNKLQEEYIINMGSVSLSAQQLLIHVENVPFDDQVTFDFAKGLQFSFKTTFLFDNDVSLPGNFLTLLFYQRQGELNPYCGVGDINNFTPIFDGQSLTKKISLKHSFLHLGAQNWVQDVSINI